MIRVYIELFPGGDIPRKKGIAQIDIWNVTELSDVSNYRWQGEFIDMLGSVKTKQGRVEGHLRADGGIALLRKVLAQADRTDSRGAVTDDERIADLSASLLMLAMAVESQCEDPEVLAIAKQAREALKRSGK